MSSITRSYPPTPDQAALQRRRGWYLGLGVLLMILGIAGLYLTFAVPVFGAPFSGALVLIAAALQLLQAFQHRRWGGLFWHGLIALLYTAVGLLMLIHLPLAAGLLTFFFSTGLMLIGVVRMLMAFRHRADPNWKWLLLAGVVSLLLGVIIAVGWPIAGLWVIGVFVSVELALYGWSYLVSALRARPAPAEPARR